jgi:hypothetical protein
LERFQQLDAFLGYDPLILDHIKDLAFFFRGDHQGDCDRKHKWDCMHSGLPYNKEQRIMEKQIGKLERLRELGFEKMGVWKLQNGALAFELTGKDRRGNFLYAFISGSRILFLEYSRLPLEARMDAYKHTDHRYAGTFQPMNKRLREKILVTLEGGEAVEIWALYPGEMEYKGYRVDLAAGLTDGLLKEFTPEWNGYLR